jgi:hypothetical protein
MGNGDNKQRKPVLLVTLGPTGTCHERAVREYAAFQGVEDYRVEFITDFFDGLEMIRGREDAFLVQCSAHPLVHKSSAGGRWRSRGRWESCRPPRATSTCRSGTR